MDYTKEIKILQKLSESMKVSDEEQDAIERGISALRFRSEVSKPEEWFMSNDTRQEMEDSLRTVCKRSRTINETVTFEDYNKHSYKVNVELTKMSLIHDWGAEFGKLIKE